MSSPNIASLVEPVEQSQVRDIQLDAGLGDQPLDLIGDTANSMANGCY